MINGLVVPAPEHRIFGVSLPNQQVSTLLCNLASPWMVLWERGDSTVGALAAALALDSGTLYSLALVETPRSGRSRGASPLHGG